MDQEKGVWFLKAVTMQVNVVENTSHVYNIIHKLNLIKKKTKKLEAEEYSVKPNT